MKALCALFQRGRLRGGLSLGGFVAGMMLALQPASATEFTGGGFITDYSAGCAGYWSGTNQVVARMRPAGLPSNPANSTSLSLFYDTYTIGMAFGQMPALNVWTNVTSYTSISGVTFHSTTPNPVPQIRFTTRPANFNSAELALVFEIRNLDLFSNCNARGSIMLYRR